MLVSLLSSLSRRFSRSTRVLVSGPIRLHVGGKQVHPDWKILDVLPGSHVDYVGACNDLSAFADASVLELYASHVVEHLGYVSELPQALAEFHRVLVPGGRMCIGVPDLPTLCGLFLDPALDVNARFHVMRMMFGGQMDAADFHRTGFDEATLRHFLVKAGFVDLKRVEDFGLFDDTSRLTFMGKAISLNLEARRG